MGALAAYNDKATDRYFTTVAASLALASKSILDKEDGMVLKPTYNKQNLLSDLSTLVALFNLDFLLRKKNSPCCLKSSGLHHIYVLSPSSFALYSSLLFSLL